LSISPAFFIHTGGGFEVEALALATTSVTQPLLNKPNHFEAILRKSIASPF
jgi:hypothetical protein